VSSQGQRFRRRALRRGYKVDEVDGFLDRVEATLSGEMVGPPVGAQEVHDVVFRVRFGGYDEWQVDLHLDRVERQLAEFEDRRGGAPAPDPMRDSMRSGLTTGSIGLGAGMGSRSLEGPGQGMGPGPGMSGAGMGGRGMDSRGMDSRGMDSRGMDSQGMGGQGMGGQGRMAPPTERLPAPTRDDRMAQQQQMPQRQPMQQDPYGRYDEPPPYGQQPPSQQQLPPQLPQRSLPPGGGYDQGGYDPSGYDGFEAGRHGKTDMTAEIRMPQREQDTRGGYGGPPTGGGMPNAPMSAAPMSGSGGYGGPPQPQMPPLIGEPGGELYRVDQLRRTFQPRRFGSGYDPMQVDRLFEGILQAMTGRGPMPVPENELDMLQFGLVPGGYFEAEVDAALREVKDILLRHR
jgi:DivIVA domain-containing protein